MPSQKEIDSGKKLTSDRKSGKYGIWTTDAQYQEIEADTAYEACKKLGLLLSETISVELVE